MVCSFLRKLPLWPPYQHRLRYNLVFFFFDFNLVFFFFDFKKKELEAELVNVTGAAKPTRKIRYFSRKYVILTLLNPWLNNMNIYH